MKSLLKKIIAFTLRNPKVRFFLLRNLLSVYKHELKNNIIFHYRKDILNELFAYPSLINNGYLHIDRTIELLKSRNVAGTVIIDIGAAGGETSIMFASAFPLQTVVSFEPIAETFRRLEKNTQSFSNITRHHCALGSTTGTTEINITNRITSSSLLSTNAHESFGDNKYFEIIQKERINIRRLDDAISEGDSVILIKIDVQGFELEVLKGAVNTLTRTSFVLLEMQNHSVYKGAPMYYDLDQFLREHSFELFEIIPSIRVESQVKEFDALYIKKAIVV